MRTRVPIAITLVVLLATAIASTMPRGFAADGQFDTTEVWKFKAFNNALAISVTKDVSGDDSDDLIVAANDKSVYMVNGLTGRQIWNYTAGQFYQWRAAAEAPDVNGDGKPEALVATRDNLVMLLDGAKGKQIWNFSRSEPLNPAQVCYPVARSAQIISDLDADGLPDVILVSGTGDLCQKGDKFAVLALSAKSGNKIWEYVHEEDLHGLKDGTRGSSPTAVVDINKDGFEDVAVVDERNVLYVVSGKTGNARETKINTLGATWNLMTVPDLSGDGVKDAIALEFIDGGGGPDYASIDAIDLVASRAIWQAKAGDGFYDSGAVYTTAWIAANDNKGQISIAAVQRVNEDLQLILLDANTGQSIWEFELGRDVSGNDIERHYSIARVPDSVGNDYDEIVIGSIDSKAYLLDGNDGDVIWAHRVIGGIDIVAPIQGQGGKTNILIGDRNAEVLAVNAKITTKTSLSISVSAQSLMLDSKLVISGSISPPLAGEVVQLYYKDPSGVTKTKPLVIAKDGTYTDTINPDLAGTWTVYSKFTGEEDYFDSQSTKISFDVLNEEKSPVYKLEVEDGGSKVSYPISYDVQGGQITGMSISKQQKALNIAITPSAVAGGTLRIELPRSVIDTWTANYQVNIDGKAAAFEELKADTQTRTLSIPFTKDSRQIQVMGTYVVPEFPLPLVLMAIGLGTAVILARRSRLLSFSVRT